MVDGHSKTPKDMTASGKKRASLSIAGMLFLLVVMFFLGPLAFSNYWGYSQSRDYLTQAAFRNIRNVAALQAAETLQFVRSAESLLPSIVMGNQQLFSIMREWAATKDSNQRGVLTSALQAHLAAKAREGASVAEFYILSPDGVLAASSSSGRLAGRDLSQFACFEGSRNEGRGVGFDFDRLSPVTQAAAQSKPAPGHEDTAAARDGPSLIVGTPIRDNSGVFLGIFCGRFDFDIHRQSMIAHQERTADATLYLLDDHGRIVSGSFGDRSTELLGRTFASTLRPAPPTRRTMEGRYELKSGDEMLVAYAHIPIFDWTIVVEEPVTRALADLERLKWKAMTAGIALGGVLLACVFLVWRLVVLPLRALSHASESMANGASGETVEPRGPSELMDLAAAFNRMSLGLKDSQDLLEWRIAERTRELRESQGFLELILDSIDQRVIVVDLDLKIIRANSAAFRMHGSPLLGKQCCAALESAPTPSPDCPIRRTIDTGKPISEERSQLTVNGIEPVRVETYPIFDAQGQIESVAEIGHVITEEKRLQAQMAHHEKIAAFGELAAGVAHEIGNPLAAIQSQLQLAQTDPRRMEQTLSVVEQQADRMARILRQIVDFTRRRTNETMLTSANDVVQDVAHLVEHHPRAQAISIEFELRKKLPAIRINEDHLVQVLLNLSLNSIDAIEGRGTLTFETAAEHGDVVIRVRDTGNGIPDDARDHVFEPFFSTKEQGPGTGLGLFVSKQIIESMGGQLELKESGPQGTVFLVRIATGNEDGTTGSSSALT